MQFTVDNLLWPPRSLSPNSREHRMEKAAANKSTRKAAWAIAKEAIGRSIYIFSGVRVPVCVTFHPPGKYHYDDDNLLALAKSTIDGVAQALGVDDALFQVTIARGAPVKYGKIAITVDVR